MGFLLNCGCVNTTVWMHPMDTNKMHGEKLDEAYTKILCAALNKSWKQQPTKQLLYGHLPLISQTI